MMSVKGGTQTWSNAAQKVDYKSDGANNLSAGDKEKYFDGESIGDTLNKVADPNFVDTSKKPRAVGNSELGKDAFMTLLLTQMKNQDPTNPLKSHEMAAQLAQFTSLEKLNNINESIAALRKDQQPDHNFQALAMIGKVVTMDNSKIPHSEAGESHDLRFSLATDAQKASIEVRDANGDTVRKLEVKNLKAGQNQLQWNGKNDDGVNAPVGDYTLSVEAFGSNGKKIYAQTKAEGQITGVNFTAHGVQLLMGKQAINMADVKSISDPNVKEESKLAAPQAALGAMPGAAASVSQNKSNLPPGLPPELAAMMAGAPGSNPLAGLSATPPEHSASAQGPRKVEVKPETKANSAKRASLSKGNIADAAMSQGLINRLNKEGAKAGGMQGS